MDAPGGHRTQTTGVIVTAVLSHVEGRSKVTHSQEHETSYKLP